MLRCLTLAILLAAAWLTFTIGPVAAANTATFDRGDLDTTCLPCQNFYQFATGGWAKRHPIAPSYATWGRFSALQDKNQQVLHTILEDAARAKNLAPGTTTQKIGDFYGSCMDSKQIEAGGIKPIEPELGRIAAIKDLSEFQDEVARLQSQGVGALFYFGSSQDDKDSTQMIAVAAQGGIGLPTRGDYLDSDDHAKTIREQYRQHIANMFALAGDAPSDAASHAAVVLAVETRLAQSSKNPVDLRDPQANYHKMTPAELRALTPGFSWDAYFRTVGFPAIAQINVGQPDFFGSLSQSLSSVSLEDWKTYLRWHLLHSYAAALSSPFVDENFSFYGKILTGAKEIQPRWKRCVASTDRNLGEALGQVYVAKVFPPETKVRARAMVDNLVSALRADLATLPWMGDATRQQALAKLAAMSLKIGYPDTWRDYSAFQVERASYVENLARGSAFEFHRNLAKIGRPVDRTEWDMTPPTVNAYYDANKNEIVFPAGILQTPFFDAKADDALNYGGIGAVIGHEMTHGFDDEGRQYDGQGNLRDWWTPEDLKNFTERATCVEKQFDGFVVAGDVHENGKLVLGESIADLGGLTLAHLAFERALAAHPAPARKDGFTPEQRFFLSWARVWTTVSRPEYELQLTKTNPHPLPRFRTNGVVANIPEFAAAFGCQSTDPMARDAAQRCKIW